MIDYKKEFLVNKMEFNPKKVYPVWGKFINPTDEELRRHSTKPFKMFTPTDGSYKMTFYNEEEIIKWIKAEK